MGERDTDAERRRERDRQRERQTDRQRKRERKAKLAGREERMGVGSVFAPF